MADLKSLIAELESAKEGSRELDAMIENWLEHGSESDLAYILTDIENITKPAPYTFSLDAALTLVPEGWYWQISEVGLAWVGTHLTANKPVRFDGDAVTPAIALCIASLRAKDAA